MRDFQIADFIVHEFCCNTTFHDSSNKVLMFIMKFPSIRRKIIFVHKTLVKDSIKMYSNLFRNDICLQRWIEQFLSYV